MMPYASFLFEKQHNRAIVNAMSSRFKIKSGDTEIEFEGPAEEVSSKFKEAFDWLKTIPIKPSTAQDQKGEKSESAGQEKKQGKSGSRGGPRSSVIGAGIDELIESGFFSDFVPINKVFEELKRKKVPVASTIVVNTAVGRRVPKVLDRIKNEQGIWVYRKKA